MYLVRTSIYFGTYYLRVDEERRRKSSRDKNTRTRTVTVVVRGRRACNVTPDLSYGYELENYDGYVQVGRTEKQGRI